MTQCADDQVSVSIDYVRDTIVRHNSTSDSIASKTVKRFRRFSFTASSLSDWYAFAIDPFYSHVNSIRLSLQSPLIYVITVVRNEGAPVIDRCCLSSYTCLIFTTTRKITKNTRIKINRTTNVDIVSAPDPVCSPNERKKCNIVTLNRRGRVVTTNNRKNVRNIVCGAWCTSWAIDNDDDTLDTTKNPFVSFAFNSHPILVFHQLSTNEPAINGSMMHFIDGNWDLIFFHLNRDTEPKNSRRFNVLTCAQFDWTKKNVN